MTLGEPAYRYRLELQDEAVGVRKSWCSVTPSGTVQETRTCRHLI